MRVFRPFLLFLISVALSVSGGDLDFRPNLHTANVNKCLQLFGNAGAKERQLAVFYR
jgi:hypothetical protein